MIGYDGIHGASTASSGKKHKTLQGAIRILRHPQQVKSRSLWTAARSKMACGDMGPESIVPSMRL